MDPGSAFRRDISRGSDTPVFRRSDRGRNIGSEPFEWSTYQIDHDALNPPSGPHRIVSFTADLTSPLHLKLSILMFAGPPTLCPLMRCPALGPISLAFVSHHNS